MTTQSQSAGHAVRIHSYGGPEQMRCELVMVPSPAPGEVQIRQHAIGINYLDTYHRRGVFSFTSTAGCAGR
jgi:NADPH2:quinone reductase